LPRWRFVNPTFLGGNDLGERGQESDFGKQTNSTALLANSATKILHGVGKRRGFEAAPRPETGTKTGSNQLALTSTN
jgi:hypothetical protein